MKKTLTIIALTLLLISCSSSDSGNNPPLSTTPVTDIDGNSYNSIIIGSQVWMQRNLDVTHYRNGDVIPQVTDENQWEKLTTGAWCYYDNDPANASYGKLYNAYAVHDPRGLAPQGYHIPSQNEFRTLINFSISLNYSTQSTIKEIGYTHWEDPNDTSNITGFTALGSGTRGSSINDSAFAGLKGNSHMWSSTFFPGSILLTFAFSIFDLKSEYCNQGYPNKFGHSVRCIKD